MKTIEQQFTVSFHYPVIFCRHLFAADCEILANLLARDKDAPEPHRVLFVIDRGVERAYPQLGKQIIDWLSTRRGQIELASPVEFVPGNEFAKKHGSIVEKLIKLAYQIHFGRKDTFVVIGGGAVQDVVGYVAGILHRGCHVIRVNTTTLSQADAGVGVKNGIDYCSSKNFLGTFAPPFAVINDTEFLPTLSDKDWSNGLAEAVKVAVIKDRAFFQELEEQADLLRMRDLNAMEAVIQQTAALHLAHIANGGDPFEHGAARPLDFGHWSAHRLEVLSCFQLSHGEAVAIGIALDMIYATDLGWVTESECARVITLLRNCGLRIWCDELSLRGSDSKLAILEGLRQFREHLGGQLCVTLPKGIGTKAEVHEMDEARIERSITQLHDRYS
ncbi:MAG: 3-dehydroquinate synthase [Kiritimatiellia bacterium]